MTRGFGSGGSGDFTHGVKEVCDRVGLPFDPRFISSWWIW